jgi:membrane protein implicated in regulation of membrane protease activity
MIVLTGAAVLVVAAIAALAIGSWWALAIPLAAHAIGSVVVVTYALKRASQTGGKPDPVTEARIEEERGDLKARRRATGQVNPAKDREVF